MRAGIRIECSTLRVALALTMAAPLAIGTIGATAAPAHAVAPVPVVQSAEPHDT